MFFLTKSSPYNTTNETVENMFVKNIEQIISSENNQWKSIHVNINNTSNKEKTKLLHKFFQKYQVYMDIVRHLHL